VVNFTQLRRVAYRERCVEIHWKCSVRKRHGGSLWRKHARHCVYRVKAHMLFWSRASCGQLAGRQLTDAQFGGSPPAMSLRLILKYRAARQTRKIARRWLNETMVAAKAEVDRCGSF
jgi:hypothetical protein